MKTKSDILSVLSTLRDYLQESHQDDIDHDHHGDEGECSYCKAIEEADAILASSSSPDDESVPTSDFVASCHSLGAHVIDASRPYDEMKKNIIRLIALAIEGSEEYVANDLRHVVERVYQSEDVLWTLREQLPHCEWFECYERFYNAGLLIKID